MSKILLLKKYWKIFLTIIFILIILISIFGIIYISKNYQESKITSAQTNLKGYSELKAKIDEINSDPEIANLNLYDRFISKLTENENPTLTEKERGTILKQTVFLLQGLYSKTNNPKLRELGDMFANFVKQNYPKQYEENYFRFYCQDPTCANAPQPEEIDQIIKAIENSDFPKEVIESEIISIQNIGYLPKDDPDYIFDYYVMYAIKIRNYSSFTKTDANILISDAVYKFLQNEYPKQYEKALDNTAITKYGLRKFN